MEIMVWVLITIISVLLSVLSWQDIRHRILSNKLIFAVFLTALPLGWLLNHTLYWQPALITLVIGFFLFLFNVIGAGDIKLLTVLMLLVPPNNAFFVLLLISLFGLLLIIGGLLFFRSAIKKNGLPYGVAISLGFLSYLFLFINIQLLP
ncbi:MULTISPECIES: A24 family peptidase [unclassified Avibacterium]|uniref:A24 family peptidase n=1 Tax=unclassified Avibacterium TaxID=2685287 RepID=UPI002026B243|nr:MULTISPECIES: prepilin peptidase [unclassified Avibacterium]MCW9698100.1 prepilin peptidase [Avibacterium sp. 20-129]URL05579.1 prepilin peptidase [Avibacterium sp. 21-595]